MPDGDGLRFRAAGRADVPRQFLGPGALLSDARRAHGDARRAARRRLGLRPSGDREGDDDRGGPDGLARPAALSAQREQEALGAQVRRHRRLGVPARVDPRLPGRLRRRSASRLGNDGNEPGRLGRLDQAEHDGTLARGEARAPEQAGLGAVRRRNEDRRR